MTHEVIKVAVVSMAWLVPLCRLIQLFIIDHFLNLLIGDMFQLQGYPGIEQ